jgi:predicted DsbA family dithiol-disulfide isomerase
VGKRELELAAARNKVDLELICKPFMLDPRLPEAGVDKMQHYMRKFGPQMKRMLTDPDNPLNVRGRPIGLDFRYHEGSKVFNTLKAHKLLTWAAEEKGPAKQATLKEIFLRRYLSEGANLGQNPELLDAVREAELPAEEAQQVLEEKHPKSGAIDDRLQDELADSHSKVNGVPAFYFPDGTTFSGAQDGSVFDRAFRAQK